MIWDPGLSGTRASQQGIVSLVGEHFKDRGIFVLLVDAFIVVVVLNPSTLPCFLEFAVLVFIMQYTGK